MSAHERADQCDRGPLRSWSDQSNADLPGAKESADPDGQTRRALLAFGIGATEVLDQRAGRTCSACGPLGPCVISNSTAWFSSRLLYPSPWMAEKWTNTSSPPPS